MTSRHRARRVRKALIALSLCFAVVMLGTVLRPGHPAEETGTSLDRRVRHLHVVNLPLEQVVDELSWKTGQPIEVEWDQLALAERSPRQAKATIDLDDVTLYSALQAAFGTLHDPVRYGVSRGVITVSSRAVKWDTVARTYDVSDLLRSFSDQRSVAPSRPAYLAGPSRFAGAGSFGAQMQPPFTTGRIGPSSSTVTPRVWAMDELTLLVCSVLANNPLNSAVRPSVTQWGERLIVVATEPQQRYLQRFMALLRKSIASRANQADDAQSGAGEGVLVPPMCPRDDSDAVLDCVISSMEFPRMSLHKAMSKLARLLGVMFVIQSPDVSMDDLVEAHLRNVTLRDALSAILSQLRPIPPFYADGKYVCIGAEKAETRLYDIRPLLPQMKGAEREDRMNVLSPDLADRIRHSIRRVAWLGEFNMPVIEWDGILVVRATPPDHLELSQFLNKELLGAIRQFDRTAPQTPTTGQAGDR